MLSRWFKWLIAERETLPVAGQLPPTQLPRSAELPGAAAHTLSFVAIVEDYSPLRGIIRRILETESDLLVVGEASDGIAGCELLRKTQPTVLITDMVLPGLSGPELIRFARKHHPDIAIVAVSIHSEDPYVRSALDSGARAFVHKSCLHEHLAEAVRSVMRGEQYLRLP